MELVDQVNKKPSNPQVQAHTQTQILWLSKVQRDACPTSTGKFRGSLNANTHTDTHADIHSLCTLTHPLL